MQQSFALFGRYVFKYLMESFHCENHGFIYIKQFSVHHEANGC